MLQFKNSPKELMSALDKFLSNYYGDLQIESGRDLAEIAAWKIPDSLKYFYLFAEKYPAIIDLQTGLLVNNGEHVHHDELFIGELLYWKTFTVVSTKIQGEDPPVWISQSKGDESQYVEKLVCNSLSQFIATFCLEQAVLGTAHFYNFANINGGIDLNYLLSAIAQQDYQIDLLWETINFWDIVHQKTPRIEYYYLVEDAILICSNGYCATNHKNANRLIESVLLL